MEARSNCEYIQSVFNRKNLASLQHYKGWIVFGNITEETFKKIGFKLISGSYFYLTFIFTYFFYMDCKIVVLFVNGH